MKFILLIYTDQTLLDDLPPDQPDAMMRDCLTHADTQRQVHDFVWVPAVPIEVPGMQKLQRLSQLQQLASGGEEGGTVSDAPVIEAEVVGLL
jgi:hypothetical protein